MKWAPRVLMCPPDYFGIEYEINPWMSRTRVVDRRRAMLQWNALRCLLERCGAVVSCLCPAAGLPDVVFTANAALIWHDLAVLSRFRHPQRQGEEPLNCRWFSDHGYRIHRLKSQVRFEGAGDALFCGDTLFAGYRIRSDIRACQELGELLACRVVPLELVQPRYYHLDTCFCPLTVDSAVYYPRAFDECRGLRCRDQARPAGRRNGPDACRGHVLGRPLRRCEGSIRPLIVVRHAYQRSRAGRNCQGGGSRVRTHRGALIDFALCIQRL